MEINIMMNELNEAQMEAVSFKGANLLVLAGAGTGKTKTIIGRAAFLINNGISPSHIQILTFTKKAANEIVERVKSQFPKSTAGTLSGSTFHSWCNQLIVKYPNLFGASAYTVIDQDDQLSIMKMVCGEYQKQFSKLRLKPQELIDLYSYARNTRKNLTESIRHQFFKGKQDKDTNYEISAQKEVIVILLKAYQARKGESKYLDYDDLLLAVITQIHTNPEASELLSQQIQHLLVDEVQDTNPLQWELIKPFSKICKLFCVGDDAQSIYSFRGADFKNIHRFTEIIENSTVHKLVHNYRSTQRILDLANWLLQKSPIAYNKDLRSSKPGGALPIIFNSSDQWQEASWVGDRILEGFRERDKLFGDHLVLSRSQYYTKTLQAVFIRRKIPFVTYGGRKFLEAAHIKDLVSALRILNNPLDQIAWMRFLTFWEGIGDVKASKALATILADDPTKNPKDIVENSLPGPDGKKIGSLLGRLFALKGNIDKLVEETYTHLELQLAYKYRKDWQEKRKGDFDVLKLLANSYSSLGEFISEGLLDNAKNVAGSPVLKGSELSPSEQKDHVIISTIHSAKGLEADTCFVLDVSPRNFPSVRSLDSSEAIEEDRRLLYVALTRAKNQLYITRNISSINATEKNQEVQGESNKEAYFFSKLPEHLIEQRTYLKFHDKARDSSSPNSLDLSLGMDFS